MTVNPFFNLYKNKQEQSLVEDLINESINMLGFDAYYIPNTNESSRDLIYWEDPLKHFDDAYVVTAYLSNSVDPGMNNEFFSKFGLEIRNNVRILIARREFTKKVDPVYDNRPAEGSLVYIPFLSGNGELYEVKFVNDTSDFFTLGRKLPYYWELELELFKYSNEEINTGIEEIDMVNEGDAYAIEYILDSGSGNYILKEYAYQGNSFLTATAKGIVQDWDAPNKTIKLTNISGEFSNTSSIIGANSAASYTILSFDPLDTPQFRDAWDNKVLEDQADSIVDTTVNNPFGMLWAQHTIINVSEILR